MSLLLAAGGGTPTAESHIERHALPLFQGFTNQLLMSIVAAVLGIVVFVIVAKKMQPRQAEGAKGYITKCRFGGFFEMILVYLRNETVKPLLHDKTDKYIGFLWSLFFFILFANILGIVPIGPVAGLLGNALGVEGLSHVGGTFTGSWGVTIGLSAVACVAWLFVGLREGGMGYIKHYWVIPLKGQSIALMPVLIPVGLLILFLELLGNVLIKPFALSVRLVANMMAGHMVLGSLVLLSVFAYDSGGYFGSVIAFFGALAIYFLELFVAFLQAYIFMFLTTIFISMGLPHGDHDHEHGDHAHGEAAAAH